MKFNDAMYSKVGLGKAIQEANAALAAEQKRLPGAHGLPGSSPRVDDSHLDRDVQRRLAGITHHERGVQAAHGGMPIYAKSGSAGMLDDSMATLEAMGVRPKLRGLFENSKQEAEVRMPPIRSRRPPHLKFMVTSMQRDGVNVEEEKMRVAEMLRRQGYSEVTVEVIESPDVGPADEQWAVRDAPGQEDMDASRDMEDRAIARDAKEKNARRRGRHNESVQPRSFIVRKVAG